MIAWLPMSSPPELPETTALRRVTFADLTRIRSQLNDARLRQDEGQARLGGEYDAALERFENEHGEITHAYWCATAEGAVALTAGRTPPGWTRNLISVSPRLHHHTDLATREAPDIARALDRCYELALRAREELRGRNRRITITLMMRSSCRLLMLLDSKDGRDAISRGPALGHEERAIAERDRDYRDFVDGDRKIVYVLGIVLSVSTLGLLFAMCASIVRAEPGTDDVTIVACLVAGALGAAVSVFTRLNNGTLRLSFDFPYSRGYILFLGALRPIVGSVFGLLAFFMLTSTFVQLFAVPDEGSSKRFYFLSVIAFAAGFSERWAQDTLTGGLASGASHEPPGLADTSRRARGRASRSASPQADDEPHDMPDLRL
jgi:hypothetical protein